jgi:hypothetical protein
MLRNDYLMRIVEQITEAMARIARLRDDRQHEAALRELEQAYELLGIDPRLLTTMSESQLADLLAHPDKIRLAARLTALEAEIRAAAGDERGARRDELRALELYLETRKRDAGHSDDDRVIDALRARVLPGHE